MKLYDGGRAPNPRRVQIFLKEKNIELEKMQVNINALDQKSADFTKLNPMQTLPVLVLDDGTAISETIAICRYFEELQPEPNLMGTTALEKAVIEMWQRRVELNFLMPVAFAFRHLHPGAKVLEAEQVARWGEINQPRAEKFMAFLNEELANRKFVAGERFTIADITTLVTCQFLKPARLALAEDLIYLNQWYEKVSTRASAQFD